MKRSELDEASRRKVVLGRAGDEESAKMMSRNYATELNRMSE